MRIPQKAHSSNASFKKTKQIRKVGAVLRSVIAEVTIKWLMYFFKQRSKHTMVSLLFFLLLCFGVSNVHGSRFYENSEDLCSLIHFKQCITNDPKGALSNWNLDTHFCQWNGVNCSSTRPWRVTGLNLTGQSLAGQINSSLGNLTFLETLDLSNNRFLGTIPLLNRLQYLMVLYLQSNFLQGVIPDAITNCSNLVYLDLSQNMLSGMIAPSIGSLSKLKRFFLYGNNLTGVIPATIGNITSLEGVGFSQNQFSGRYPDKIWQVASLKFLYLDENNLSGAIPHISSNTSSLTQLSLAVNWLGNALPSNMGNAFPNLEILYLGGNNFVGHIPSSLGNASGLEDIDLSLNHFTGKIPSSFRKLSGLYSLNLGTNNLEARDNEGWEFFHALANCSYLDKLVLSKNNLQGSLPNSIGNLSPNIRFLELGGNQLPGLVPPSIQKLNGLVELSLDSSNFIGTIQDWTKKLTNLQYLNLKSNNFIGTIPLSIYNLTQLVFFSIAENELTGFLPPSIGNLKAILTLNLSYNSFHGSIPVEFGNFLELTILDLSSNKLSGEIPETLGQCQHIYTIRIDNNILTGNIPGSISNLKSLSIFNVSHNNLSGPLPAYLNDLRCLTNLDLSCNNFQGEIPQNGLFKNATIVSLDGNPRLCGGYMDLQVPSCHVVSRRKEEIVIYMLKTLIPIFGFMSLATIICFIIHRKKTSIGSHSLLFSFGRQFPKVSYKDLAQATGNFSESNLIGRGSYGSVFRGKLTNAKIEVAIKVFDLDMSYAHKSFLSECEVLRRIRHRNLLFILSACSTVDNKGNEFKALIYEFMHNGNLDTLLHDRHARLATNSLGLVQRINIAVGIADALAYMHHDYGRPIVHCDLKPTNILLDDDMNAHLGDFGMASLVLDSTSAALEQSGPKSVAALTGTIGYIAPEYAQSVNAATYGDVYSFGIVLMEMLTGKRPTDNMFGGELNIVSYVGRNFPDQMLHITDAQLRQEIKGTIQARLGAEMISTNA